MSHSSELYPIFEPDNRKINSYSNYFLGNNHRFPIDGGNNLNSMNYMWDRIFNGGWKHGFSNRILKYLFLRNEQYIEYNIQKYSNRKISNNSLINYKFDSNFKSIVPQNIISIFDKIFQHKEKNKTILIKSVHCIRQLNWISQHFNPKIIIIIRKLPNLIASYLRLKLNDSYRGISNSSDLDIKLKNITSDSNIKDFELFKQITTQACELMCILKNYHLSNKNSILINHEEACLNPTMHFENLKPIYKAYF